MSIEHQESSIFEETAFKTEKGKAYPNIGQLFLLIPVAIGLVFLIAIPWGIYMVTSGKMITRGETSELEKTSILMTTAMTFGVMIGLFLFMFWKKKRKEPAFQIKIEQPVISLLAKVFLTLFMTYITVMLLGRFLPTTPLQLALNGFEIQLKYLGFPLTTLTYGLLLPIVSSLIVYNIGYDGLLKNYSYKSVFLIGVIGLSVLYISPALILLALPVSILDFLVYYKSRNVLYIIIPGIALELTLILTMHLSNTDDILDIALSIPIWISGIIAAIAGLCWFVLLQDLRKMEVPEAV